MGLSLSAEQIVNLVSRTEGWISGLHLAALSLQKSGNYPEFIRAFSGEHRSISDYLFQEAFAILSDDMQSFLLQTSILDRMNDPLCEAVTGQAESQGRLFRQKYAAASKPFHVKAADWLEEHGFALGIRALCARYRSPVWRESRAFSFFMSKCWWKRAKWRRRNPGFVR
ncbi:hypothetical protein ACFPPD_19505 [Cohnella suwonensis]|uniref:MalT-like winged helix domain-containing protein n=1 Tax=Cohnella suwonensis TaxID=696072 RepID=A0ABW0LYE6_9BACL